MLIDDIFLNFECKASQDLFQKFLKQGLRDKTVIYCSQKLNFSSSFSNFVILDEGKILAQGKQSEFKKTLKQFFEDMDDIDSASTTIFDRN